MNLPLVSICIPNLNNIRFLPERIETIQNQTYQNIEIIVSDNYSNDGAWEFFQDVASQDQRFDIKQAPRNGMYANWNNCILRCKGKYIYIATSDDTMPPDCIEKLVFALETYTECGIAHCPLKTIDEYGKEANTFWAKSSAFALSSPDLVNKWHIRYAPYDGILHLGFSSVYISITQLLVRRDLFDLVGFFEDKWGSMGDFNWNMRASLVSNTIHVASTWGGWRIHGSQATAQIDETDIARHYQKCDMITCAVESCRHLMTAEELRFVNPHWQEYCSRKHQIGLFLCGNPQLHIRLHWLLSELSSGNTVLSDYLKWKILKRGNWQRKPVALLEDSRLLQNFGDSLKVVIPLTYDL